MAIPNEHILPARPLNSSESRNSTAIIHTRSTEGSLRALIVDEIERRELVSGRKDVIEFHQATVTIQGVRWCAEVRRAGKRPRYQGQQSFGFRNSIGLNGSALGVG